MMEFHNCKFEQLKGRTICAISGLRKGEEEVTFVCTDGTIFRLWHQQDCCESVSIEDIIGDPIDLIHQVLLMAECVTSVGENPPGVPVPEHQDSWTWTFYKLATIKGNVTIRWYGSSNGYYSETVVCDRTYPTIQPTQGEPNG